MPTAKWTSERDRDVTRKRLKSVQQRLVILPKCRNRKRRERLEKDDIAWLMHYFGKKSGLDDPFTYEFTEQQRIMVEAFAVAIREGGDQAIAASRGEGKTTIFERLAIKYTLQGILSYAVIFQATGTLADNSLDTIKTALEDNELLLADYPEVCVPVRALENTPNRAHYQKVNGFRHDTGEPFEMAATHFTWSGQEIILPNVPGSPSARAIIATRGLDAAVRGLKKRGKRPQLAAIDDPDTEETARSEEQAKKLEDRIDKAIGGLGSQTKPVARLLLSTIQSRISASFKFTDPEKKPSWKPKRFRFLVSPPERSDLWDEFVQLKESDWTDGTDKAHDFYQERRKEMDAGAQVANPNRHTSCELSALEHYYTLVAKIGQVAVSTEYDNDPPEDEGPIESGITATKIQRRLSGYPRRIVPPECTILTRGIDPKKTGLHWVIKAWRPDATNYVIDYGFYETHGTQYGSDEGVEHAVLRALLGLMDSYSDSPCCNIDGELRDVDLTLVDSGWQAPAVYQACREIGLGIYPAKGHGKSLGCASMSFVPHARRDSSTKPGDGWYQKKQGRQDAGAGLWLVHCDTDRWKAYEHARWLTAEGKPGAAYLFGEMTAEERKYIDKRVPKECKEHFSFAHHITAEVEVEDVIRGVLRRLWRTKAGRVQNHYLDASYLADVAAGMKGIRLLGESKAIAQGERKSLAELAREARQ